MVSVMTFQILWNVVGMEEIAVGMQWSKVNARNVHAKPIQEMRVTNPLINE